MRSSGGRGGRRHLESDSRLNGRALGVEREGVRADRDLLLTAAGSGVGPGDHSGASVAAETPNFSNKATSGYDSGELGICEFSFVTPFTLMDWRFSEQQASKSTINRALTRPSL